MPAQTRTRPHADCRFARNLDRAMAVISSIGPRFTAIALQRMKADVECRHARDLGMVSGVIGTESATITPITLPSLIAAPPRRRHAAPSG
jgi:hypothetical protein